MNISHLTPTFADIKTWVRAATVTVNQLITGKQDKSDNLTSLSGLDLTGHSGDAVVVTAGEDGFELVAGGGGGGGTTTNALTITNTGGAAPGTTFDGSVARTIDYSTVGAAASGHNHTGVYQPADTTLDAFAAYNTNGLIAQTAADTFAGRTLTGPAAGITVTNGNGVSGNPTLALANDLSALEGLGSTGIAVRTAADTWAQRTITGTADLITVTNGDGVSGNPTITRAFSGALVKKSADQTAANYSAGANITWDAEEYDTGSYHDTGSNTDRLTITTAGYYAVSGNITAASGTLTASDYIRIFVQRYNSSNVQQSTIGLPNNVIAEVSATPGVGLAFASAPILCSAGDYFVFVLDTESDTSITVVAAQSWFAIERIA